MAHLTYFSFYGTKTTSFCHYWPRKRLKLTHGNRDISKTTWNFDKRSKLVNLSNSTLQNKTNMWKKCQTPPVPLTKFNRVRRYPPRNNPVKFHQDRIRFSRVIVFTRTCWQTDDRQTTSWWQYPSFCRGVIIQLIRHRLIRQSAYSDIIFETLRVFTYFICYLIRPFLFWDFEMKKEINLRWMQRVMMMIETTEIWERESTSTDLNKNEYVTNFKTWAK